MKTKGRMQKSKANTTQTIQLQPSIVTSPMFIGNNSNKNSFLWQAINKDSNSLISELIINENQSFVSYLLRKDDITVANSKQINKIYNKNSESFISYLDIEVQTIQNKKKRKQKKKKSKIDILENMLPVVIYITNGIISDWGHL